MHRERVDWLTGVAVRPRPALLRALGPRDPPACVVVGGREFHRTHIYKHDSWAATALYADSAGNRIVCKFNRQQPVLAIPAGWIGRWLARREARFLRLLADLDAVPDLLATVFVDGEPAHHALARSHIDGTALHRLLDLDAEFFDSLSRLIDDIHRRGVVYNDLHKRENILVGADGRPWLIDFQISLEHPRNWIGKTWLAGKLMGQLRAIDRFHMRKHMLRLCWPEMAAHHPSPGERGPPALLRLHRVVAHPWRLVRRRLLVMLGVRAGAGHAASETDPEDALRGELGVGPLAGSCAECLSDGYFERCGGTGRAFIEALYRDLLGREATKPETDSWMPAVRSETRAEIVTSFLISEEFARRRDSGMAGRAVKAPPRASPRSGVGSAA